MMFEVVTNDGDVLHLFIFLHDLSLKTEIYMKCLDDVELPWIDRVTARRTNLELATGLCDMPHKVKVSFGW